MAWLNGLNPNQFVIFTLVLSRVSGLVMTAPIYGTREVPMRVRALLAFALALLIMPTQWHAAVAYPGSLVNYLVFVGAEVLIGAVLGLGVVILFSGVLLAGQVIGRISGLMLADVFDPNLQAEVPTFSQLLHLLTLAIFVLMGGHRLVMAGLLDTFATIPVGSGNVPDSLAGAMVDLLTLSFALGIRAAAPVTAAVLLSVLVMGLISRTLPQMNILAVGFGLNSMVALGVLATTIGASALIFQNQLDEGLHILLQALHVGIPAS